MIDKTVTILDNNADLNIISNALNFSIQDIKDFNDLSNDGMTQNTILNIPKSVKYTDNNGNESLTLIKGYDGSIIHFVPDEHGNRQKVVMDKDGNITHNSFTVNENNFTTEEKDQTSQYAQEEMIDYIKENAIKLDNTNVNEETLNSLPQGFAVRTPQSVQTIIGENGNIKLFENYDDTATIIFPDADDKYLLDKVA